MAGERSPRRGRLSKSADFDRVLRSGRSHAGRDLVLYVFPRGGDEPPRLGMSVSRKVGGAVERNTVKRMLREAFALECERMPEGCDAVVVARTGAGELAANDGMQGIRNALAELIDKVDGAKARAASTPDGSQSVMRVARRVAVAPIRVYQRAIGPLFGQRCKYYPSCSEYAAQAVTRFGILRGLILAGWRLLRCNPWSLGGYDPVENQRLFKSRTPATSA